MGYTIIELIVERWGMAAIRDLVASNGDVPGVLGLPTADFEAAWHEFLEERYL